MVSTHLSKLIAKQPSIMPLDRIARRSLLTLFGSISIVGLAALVFLPVLLSVFLFLGIRFYPADSEALLSFDNFLNSANWIQAVVSWSTLVVAIIAVSQIIFLRQQTKLEQERAERELYRPLLSPEMKSIRRLLYDESVRRYLTRLGRRVKLLQTKTKGGRQKISDQQVRGLLEKTRKEFNRVAAQLRMPLIPNERLTLDHVESLINEYNYLAKLIDDEILKERFATDLGIDNFRTVYERTFEFIELRRLLSKKYANHFHKYYEDRYGERSL